MKKKNKKVFKISHLGSSYNIIIDKKDVDHFITMFNLSYNIWDLMDQLDFINIKYKINEVIQ